MTSRCMHCIFCQGGEEPIQNRLKKTLLYGEQGTSKKKQKFEYLKFGLLLVRHSNAFIIQKLDFLEMFISVCRCLNANMSIFALRPYVFWKYVFMHMEYVVLFLGVIFLGLHKK